MALKHLADFILSLQHGDLGHNPDWHCYKSGDTAMKSDALHSQSQCKAGKEIRPSAYIVGSDFASSLILYHTLESIHTQW